MTELETIERAKMYMEKLANGINPIDDMPVPDDDIINNVRLSRCFFFVSDVLRRVVENGGISVSKEKKPAKIPFALPYEKRADFQFSEEPIPVSEISRRITALCGDENMKSLSYNAIRDWLESVEMLEFIPGIGGDSKFVPTAAGQQLGIQLVNRTGSRGDYQVILYSASAQHFIIDNLDAIIASIEQNAQLQGTAWLPEHDACLRSLFEQGVPIKEIAVTLKRNSPAIRARLKKLGILGK